MLSTKSWKEKENKLRDEENKLYSQSYERLMFFKKTTTNVAAKYPLSPLMLLL
jgi:hypothetical protein